MSYSQFKRFTLAVGFVMAITVNSISAQPVSPFNSNGTTRSASEYESERNRQNYNRSLYNQSQNEQYYNDQNDNSGSEGSSGSTTPTDLHSAEKEGMIAYRDALTWRYGFKDVNYTIVVPPKYDEVTDFTTGLSLVRLKYKYGVIDKTGKEIIPVIYDDVVNIHTENISALTDGKWIALDRSGKQILTPRYDNIINYYEGLAAVCENKKYGYIDKAGNVILPLIYTSAEDFYNGMACVALNGKYGWIDKTGKAVIPLIYDDVWGMGPHFKYGLASVSIDGKYGFIDNTGKIVIPLTYMNGGDFSMGFTLVQVSKNQWGILYKTGEMHILPVKGKVFISKFSEGLAAIKNENDKKGYINAEGKLVIGFKYDFSGSFSEGRASVTKGTHQYYEKNDHFYIDKNGARLKD
jgi:hypothetical protein